MAVSDSAPAGLLIPADAKQALRLRRLGLAALSYVLATALVAIAWAFGVLSAPVALEVGAAYVVLNLGLYAAIRSGFNLRFADPSLTTFQILAAITVLMYVVYQMDEGRNIALFACFVVFLFGLFRHTARDFKLIVLFTLGAYALVINLLMSWRPQAIRSVPLEWMSWLGLAGLLPCFSVIGGQMNALRRRLRDSEARFRNLTEMSSDFYWESDPGHRVTTRSFADPQTNANGIFQRPVRTGERRWEVPYLSPDEAGWLAHRAVLDAHLPFRGFEFSRIGNDGIESFISINGNPFFGGTGEFQGYRGVGTNVTARRRAEAALRDSAEKLRVFAENVPAMITYWGADLRCRFANKLFTEYWGLSAVDILGRRRDEIFGADVYRELEAHGLRALQGHTVTYRRTTRLAGGELRHLEIKLVPQTGGEGKVLGFFGVTTDITEHTLAQERIQRVAHHDSLTGLANRRLFDDRLTQAVAHAKRQSRRFALLYMDLDKFKPVNDVLGHQAGDELLQAVAGRICKLVRDSDTVARIGGDEFAVILADVDARGKAQAVAAKISAALALPFALGEGKKPAVIGASIGIALYPQDALDADGLVKAADSAMYDAKKLGA